MIARFNAAAVRPHLVYGLPPVESFSMPSSLHDSVPHDESTYGVMSTMISLSTCTADLHLARFANRRKLLFSVSASFWQYIFASRPVLSHFSIIWFSSCLWLTHVLGSPPTFTCKKLCALIVTQSMAPVTWVDVAVDDNVDVADVV
jgi:hypothetical protein